MEKSTQNLRLYCYHGDEDSSGCRNPITRIEIGEKSSNINDNTKHNNYKLSSRGGTQKSAIFLAKCILFSPVEYQYTIVTKHYGAHYVHSLYIVAVETIQVPSENLEEA